MESASWGRVKGLTTKESNVVVNSLRTETRYLEKMPIKRKKKRLVAIMKHRSKTTYLRGSEYWALKHNE